MLPTFKECVEELFVRGLVQGGLRHRDARAGHQHAGAHGGHREAGEVERRDARRHHARRVHPADRPRRSPRPRRRGPRRRAVAARHRPRATVAGLASTRTYPLRSSFRPSYNMAVNLVHQFGRARSRELLEMSFAQFQADQAVVGLARQLRKAEDALDGYAEAATCHLGDFMEYAALRRSISEAEKGSARARRADRREEVLASLAALRPGDVIEVPSGKFAGFAVVVDPGTAGHEPRPYVLTADRQARRLAVIDFPTPVEALGKVRVPRKLQRPQPAGAPRPRLGAARQDPRPGAAAAQRRARAHLARPGGLRRGRPAAHAAARAPLPRVPGPRGPRALGRALVQAGPRRRHAAPPDRDPDQHRRPDLRPGLRRARPRSATSWTRAARPG